jgi:putative FmdB family regulatory protein
MPINEYRCEACNKKFEKLVKASTPTKDEEIKCPKCGESKVKKTFSSFSSRSTSTLLGGRGFM